MRAKCIWRERKDGPSGSGMPHGETSGLRVFKTHDMGEEHHRPVGLESGVVGDSLSVVGRSAGNPGDDA